MKKIEALTVSIGVLAVVDTYITATVFPVPVWVTRMVGRGEVSRSW